MKAKGEWMQRLTEGMDLPAESVPGLPLVEISGEKRVLIENHRGVTQYGRDQICVRVRYGLVSVRGCELELARMSRERLVICGRIDSVSLIRRSHK